MALTWVGCGAGKKGRKEEQSRPQFGMAQLTESLGAKACWSAKIERVIW